MAKLEGYGCDTCGKQAPKLMFDLPPAHWFQVFPARGYSDSMYFCSKECFVAFALGKARVELPERPGVLFHKWLKALIGM